MATVRTNVLQERATVPESIRETPSAVRTVYSTLAFSNHADQASF